ncbi:MAG: hypothetical protein V1873_05950 [Verrucomicrobiota bacterium]
MTRRWVWLLAFGWAQAASASLLLNGGFENGTNGWTVAGPPVGAYAAADASRSGTKGLYFRGDDALASPAVVRQTVDAAAGTYTFAAWVRRESNYAADVSSLQIEWLDSALNEVQPPAARDFSTLPNDGLWHHLYVTGTCSSSDLAKVRVRMFGSWNPSAADPRRLQIDDVELYEGSYTGAWFSNGSFEYTGPWRGAQWNGSRDLLGWGSGGQLGQNWAALSGAGGVAFYSYDTNAPSWSIAVSQNVYPVSPTGTYTFALWLNQETNALFSNAVLRIEWYDSTFTNKVQVDSVAAPPVARDWLWHEYHVEGTATNPAVCEVRAVFSCDWSCQTNVGDGRATKLDNARFLTGVYDPNPVRTDWAYHAAEGIHPSVEKVPGTNGFGPFLQVNYATTTNTLYALLDHPSAARYPEEDAALRLRTAYLHPTSGAWIVSTTDFRQVDSIRLGAGTFHGQPATGTRTVSVWACEWPQPRDPNTGLAFTNAIRVRYIPYVVTSNGIIVTATNYLLRLGGAWTNNLGQLMSTNFDDTIAYYYDNYSWTPPSALTNADFEYPAAPGISNSGWSYWGAAGREDWAVRTGKYGGLFTSQTNGDSGLYQDLATTGGTYTFTLWIRQQAGAAPTNTRLSLEWYTVAGGTIRVDTRDLTPYPRDARWHRAYVTGTCLEDTVHHVRALFASQCGGGTVQSSSSLFFDDAEFYEGSFTSRQEFTNGGFEQGTNGLFASHWDASDELLAGRDDWAGRTNNWGGSFRGWYKTEPEYQASLSQPLHLAPGTYAFGAWLQREANILVTNIELRIEWYDVSLTNKVQPDTVRTVVLANAWQWYENVVTGSCFSPALYEVRPSVVAQWRRNLAASDQLAMKADDCAFSLVMSMSEDSDADGTPDWWEMLHFNNLTASGVGSNYDEDAATDFEESVADTQPTNAASVFTNRIVSAANRGATMRLTAGPPTSPSRVYDVWCCTNLEAGGWTPVGLNQPGIDQTTAVTMTVTNTLEMRFYRTGVRWP